MPEEEATIQKKEVPIKEMIEQIRKTYPNSAAVDVEHIDHEKQIVFFKVRHTGQGSNEFTIKKGYT